MNEPFEMAPFPCPHCGYWMMVDAVNTATREVKVLALDAEERFEPDGFKSMGRAQLIQELVQARYP